MTYPCRCHHWNVIIHVKVICSHGDGVKVAGHSRILLLLRIVARLVNDLSLLLHKVYKNLQKKIKEVKWIGQS